MDALISQSNISQSAMSKYASYRYEELVYKSILTVVISYIFYAIYYLQKTNTKLLSKMRNYKKEASDFKSTLNNQKKSIYLVSNKVQNSLNIYENLEKNIKSIVDEEIQILNTKIQNNFDDLKSTKEAGDLQYREDIKIIDMAEMIMNYTYYLTLSTDDDWENLFVFLSNNYPDFKCEANIWIKKICIVNWLSTWGNISGMLASNIHLIPLFNYVLYKMNYEIKTSHIECCLFNSQSSKIFFNARKSTFYCVKRNSNKIYNIYKINEFILNKEYPHFLPTDKIKCTSNDGNVLEEHLVLGYKVC